MIFMKILRIRVSFEILGYNEFAIMAGQYDNVLISVYGMIV